MDSLRILFQSCALGSIGWDGSQARVVGSVFVSGKLRTIVSVSASHMCHQRQGLHRSFRRTERTNRTLTHVCSALPPTKPLASHRSYLSSSPEEELEGVGVYTLVLERVRAAECGELYPYAFAERGDGDVVMGWGLF